MNDLAQIFSRYKVPKERLEELIEFKDKLISIECSPGTLSMSKLMRVIEFGEIPNLENSEFF